MEDEEIVDPPVVTAEEGIENLKRQLEVERAARIQAEQQTAQAQAQVRQASSTVEDTNLTLVKTAIENTKGERERLKASYANAMSQGDYAIAADIQQAMADAAARLLQLENGKDAMEQQAKQPKQQPIPVHERAEHLARQLTPRSAAWVRAHPQYAESDTLYTEMIKAHNQITAGGIPADTDEYFRGVEGILGIGTAEAPLSAAAAPTQARGQPAAAPVGRGNGVRNPNTVRLTQMELDAAEMSGQSPEEYAKNKAALKAAGRLN